MEQWQIPPASFKRKPGSDQQDTDTFIRSAQYSVVGQEGDFLKVAVDTDLEGYVFKDYMKTSVEFNKAVSVEEEKSQRRRRSQA